MNKAAVIDTNVTIVANNGHPAAGLDCVGACIDALMQARRNGVLMDASYLIFDEYRRHLSHSGQPGFGDAFFKWLWDNHGNPEHCRLIAITPMESDRTNFEEFPKDADLAAFDRSDRKFVAVALASGESPSILNATDTDWWIHRKTLERHQVNVQFLCPSLMRDEG
ncbi:MAG: hypothetical protein JWN14_1896 [Chthonomonadales bacterium]|nr:hypothetical protein [Chthonomonadales bacterium]